MKRFWIILIAVFCVSGLSAKNLKAYLSYATFNSPTDGPYVETYLSVVGKTVQYIKNTDGKYQATVEILIVFTGKDSVKNFKKTDLMSPEIDDTTKVNITFMDQQRFVLPNGDYNMEIRINDKNKPDAAPFKTKETLTINYPAGKIAVSGVELVESYKESTTPTVLTKSGYDLVPFTINFYPSIMKNLTFYTEVYNTDTVFKADEKFLVDYYIESYETSKTIANYFKFKTFTSKKVIVILDEFDITELPSGNYVLVIEVKNKSNERVTYNQVFFQRSNPGVTFNLADITSIDITNTFASKITNIDTLKDFIKSTYPISTQLEKVFAENNMKKTDLKMLQQYFYNFWINRNASDPEKSWMKYYVEVCKVNKFYSTSINKGYATDRGRVYLQYGEPNTITESVSDPSAPPYEIWLYYSLQNQRNRKFVFYLPDLVTNEYELIHSDALGEFNNPSWQMQIMKRNTTTNNPDQLKPDDYFGGKADDFFNHPP